ncbi:SH3 domain-containing protein [Clostridium tagluense]|uniref:SH3 domain-containing protein n=1 Tax=Clostridium tagluense TaxID=360422 RepID=UPI001CF30D61|nr:SH3 domain-containing protein [Clostridium tagluense]MCB2299414.1 SH3 domain-containing protein [Clostridium tagluense]
MKKRIALIVMILTMVSSQIASADSGVVNTDSLRVRQNPSLSSSIIGFLSKNTKIDTLGKQGDFYKISYNGKIGYAHTSYVNIVKNFSPPKSVVSVKPAYIEKYGVITANALNVRSGAGTTYPVIGSIKIGSKVTIYGNTNGFYKITYSGKTSYISELYVKIVNENSTSSVTPTPVTKATGVGTITASDFLSVRKTASLDSDVIVMGKKYPKEKVDIYGTQGEFYKIKYDGEWGYIYKSYVSLGDTTSNKAEYVEDGQQYNTKTTGNDLVSYSNTFLGTPYVWGGEAPAKFNATGEYLSGGFDCSGFVQYSYKNFGINLPRTTMDQVDIGASVNINNLEKGDLVFFLTNSAVPSEVSHVGIYIGDNKFIHCPKPGDVVKISELTGYYADNFVIGKRIIE